MSEKETVEVRVDVIRSVVKLFIVCALIAGVLALIVMMLSQ